MTVMKNKDVLVFSIALEGYSSLFRDCINSQRRYCLNFGFKYILVDKAPRSLKPAEAAWLKIFLLHASLDSSYKWIAFIDADCEIRHHAPSFVKKLEQFQADQNIFMAEGFSGRINSGVIFLKNSKEAKNYLESVIINGDKEVPDEDKALYENGHMIYYGKNNPNIKIINYEKWNNNRVFNERSYIQHYSGGKLREQFLKLSSRKKPDQKNRKKLKRIWSFFRKKKKKPTMKEIQSLLPFYKKTYSDIFNFHESTRIL